MKVILVAKPWRGGLAHYLYDALRAACAEDVTWLPTYPRTLGERLRYRRDRAGWRRRVIDTINAADCPVICLNVPTMDEPLAHRERNVLWLTDSAQISPAAATSFSRVFVTDPGYADDAQQAVGSDHFAGVLPFAFDPSIHRPGRGAPVRDVCFIGNRDAKRDAYLAALLDGPWRSTVVGNYWLRHPLFWKHPVSVRPSVARHRMGNVYARHRVSLNLHAAVVRQGTNMRTFECAGYGIAQVVEHRPGLDELFEPESELLTFTDTGSMIAQIDRLLHDPALATRMAQRAADRARAEHTYGHRVAALLAAL